MSLKCRKLLWRGVLRLLQGKMLDRLYRRIFLEQGKIQKILIFLGYILIMIQIFFLSYESGLRILNVRKNGAVLQKKAPGGDLQLVKNTQFWV